MRPLPADETLALRRLRVAIRQRDPRKLAIAVEHLAEDLDNGARYLRHPEWQALSDSARVELDLSPGLMARLEEVAGRIFRTHRPVAPGDADTRPLAAVGLAVVAAWDGGLASDQARASCLRVLDRSTSSSVGQLRGWLGTGASVETVASRANALLSAAHLGALDRPPPWMDALVAGIQAACSGPDEDRCGHLGLSPSLGASDLALLADALRQRPGGGIVTAHVGLEWEGCLDGPLRRLAYDPDGRHLVKLAGSLDWFYCFRCVELTEVESRVGPTSADAKPTSHPLAMACPRCGGPCWPLIAPPANPYFAPAPLRDVWAVGERVLACADTWLVVDPPNPRASDPMVRWLLRRWSPETRVFVVSRQGPVLDAWRAALERQGSARVMTGNRVEAVMGELRGLASPSEQKG